MNQPIKRKRVITNVKAEVEYVKEEGQTAGRTRILRVIEHGYTSDSYDAESKY